jgi:hypothetical protein
MSTPEPDSIFGIDLDEPAEHWTEIHFDPEYDPYEMTPEEIRVHLAEVAPIECGPDLTERAMDHMNHAAAEAEPDLDEPEPEIG